MGRSRSGAARRFNDGDGAEMPRLESAPLARFFWSLRLGLPGWRPVSGPGKCGARQIDDRIACILWDAPGDGWDMGSGELVTDPDVSRFTSTSGSYKS